MKINLKYLSNEKVIQGLYITMDFEKIMHNCQLFNIEMTNNDESNSFTKISKIINFSIVTTFYENTPITQFKVKQNLSTKELSEISDDLIPEFFKELILQGHDLAKAKTIQDLASYHSAI